MLSLAVLSPFLATGYYQDDSINSVFPTYLRLRGLTLGQFIAGGIGHWMFVEARLFPLGLAVSYSVWYFITELLAYRWIQVGLVVSNVLLLGALIRELGGGLRHALVASLLALSLFQLRDYHDPIASYTFLMQIGMCLGSAAVLLYSRFLRTASVAALSGSWILYASGLLLYETELAFFPVFLYLALRARPSKELGVFGRWGHLLITALYLGTVMVLRLTGGTVYGGTQFKLGLRAASTFLFQFSAALPLSYPIFGRSGFFDWATLASSEFLTITALFIFAAGGFFFYRVLRLTLQEPESRPGSSLRVLGWSLAILPAASIAISQKYQDQVNRPGIGYLPVYLSYFGVAVLLARVVARTRRPRLVAGVFGIVLATTFSTNRIAADRINQFWKYPRVMLEKALEAGLFSKLEPNSRIALAQPYYWISPDLVAHYGGKSVRLESLRASAPTYLLSIHVRSPQKGEVALALIDQVSWKPADASLPEQIISSHPVSVARVDGSSVRLGVVQGSRVDVLAPEFWEFRLE